MCAVSTGLRAERTGQGLSGLDSGITAVLPLLWYDVAVSAALLIPGTSSLWNVGCCFVVGEDVDCRVNRPRRVVAAVLVAAVSASCCRRERSPVAAVTGHCRLPTEFGSVSYFVLLHITCSVFSTVSG